MRSMSVAPLAAAAFAAIGASGGPAFADPDMRISGPHVHENLAVYFVHGASAGGPVPLTLQEALAKGSVQVIETGRVNELQIENTGAEQVFIQAGDIVKGGKQDRVLTVSFLLPAKSGRMPIASFCVEQGRWSARGKEDQAKFSSAARGDALAVGAAGHGGTAARAAGPATLRQRARPPGPPHVSRASPMRSSTKQRKVWDSVAATQKKLVARPQRAGRLAAVGLEPAARAGEREAEGGARRLHRRRCKPTGEKERRRRRLRRRHQRPDRPPPTSIPPTACSGRCGRKQLAAVVTEAIGETVRVRRRTEGAPGPGRAATAFLAEAEKGKSYERAGCRRRAPGDARRRQGALQRGPRRRRQVDPPQLPGEVARAIRPSRPIDEKHVGQAAACPTFLRLLLGRELMNDAPDQLPTDGSGTVDLPEERTRTAAGLHGERVPASDIARRPANAGRKGCSDGRNWTNLRCRA